LPEYFVEELRFVLRSYDDHDRVGSLGGEIIALALTLFGGKGQSFKVARDDEIWSSVAQISALEEGERGYARVSNEKWYRRAAGYEKSQGEKNPLLLWRL
jgi:hypothetical protein